MKCVFRRILECALGTQNFFPIGTHSTSRSPCPLSFLLRAFRFFNDIYSAPGRAWLAACCTKLRGSRKTREERTHDNLSGMLKLAGAPTAARGYFLRLRTCKFLPLSDTVPGSVLACAVGWNTELLLSFVGTGKAGRPYQLFLLWLLSSNRRK